MLHTRKFIQSLLTYLFLLSLVLSLIRPESAFAQARDGIKRQVDPETGKVNFISSTNGRPLVASQVLGFVPNRAADPALAIAQHFGHEFGLANAADELTAVRSSHAENGRMTVRYQQQYQGIPVLAGELIVNTNDQGDFYSMNGEVAPNLSFPTQPTIGPEQARQSALQAAAKWYRKTIGDFVTSTPTLWVFDESLLKPSERPAELVWRMEVTPANPFVPVRELVLVNAQRGSVSLHFNQIDAGAKNIGTFESVSSARAVDTTGLNTDVSASPLAVSPTGSYRKTYTANHGETLPGTLLCTQTTAVCTNGSNPDADLAHMYAAETWNFFHDHHDRDSIDNQGITIISTVEYSTDYLNAFWDGTQMVYGDGMVSDDIVGHELSHGVTQYESNLFYYYQSGAINESFSDVWGELLDQSNTSGTDTAAVKWQIGEDSPVGAFRSMSDPTLYSDPDSITSDNYDTDPLFQDNGGVHHNSGVNNKAAYLMVDGGGFGGKTVTALGANKTLAVYYEAQTNLLTSGADYADLYGALYQACLNRVGGAEGITNADCQEVRDATDAVSMNAQPTSDPNFNTDAPFCDSNLSPQAVFTDDMESGATKWTFGATSGSNRWQLDSAFWGLYASSGLHSLYANDQPATVTDSFARFKTAVAVPAGAYLHFSQAYGFEDYFFLGTFDGGVLEYSTNGGTSWTDAGSLFINNGYNGTVDSGYDNPLGGRSAFVGDSHGYISSRVNLNSLANQNVIFRWRMGLDTGGNDFGWWLDDVQIYTCNGSPNPTNPPLVSSIIRADTNPTNATDVDFIVNFSESVSGVNTNDFVLTTTGITGASITNVNGSGTTYTVTVNTGSGNGTIRLDVVDDDSIRDGNNYRLGGSGIGNGNFTSGETYTITEPSNVDVYIGGEISNSYYVASEQNISARLGINGGPVRVTSTSGLPIFTSQRAIFGSSFNSIVGYPGNQLTTDYWFTSYDDLGMTTYLVIGNPSTSQTAQVDVYIGGVKRNTTPYSIGPGQRIFPRYGINGGPVFVDGINGVNVFASQRTKFGNSFNEIMGYPANRLTTDYWFTSYDDVGMITFLVIGNPSTSQTAQVDVYIAGAKKNNTPISIAPGQRTFLRYGVNGGPVFVDGLNGVNVFASERTKFGNTFNEVMGYPANRLTTDYWFTSYDDVGMITYLVIGNPHPSQTAQVDVYIGGVKKNNTPYLITPGQRVFLRYGLNSGPVRVISTNGVNVFASERSKYMNSFNEILGMAGNQLTTDYWFTSYDDVGMDTELVIAAP